MAVEHQRTMTVEEYFQLEENDVISEACSSPLGSANSINVKFTTHDVLVVYFSQRFVSD